MHIFEFIFIYIRFENRFVFVSDVNLENTKSDSFDDIYL